MDTLTHQLDELIQRLEDAPDFTETLEELKSVYPFSRYEYIISALLAHGKLTFDEYLAIRDEYVNRNLYLHLYEMAPRTFGGHVGTRTGMQY